MTTPWRPGPPGSPARAPCGDPAAGLFMLTLAAAAVLATLLLLPLGRDPRATAGDFLERLGLVRRSGCGMRNASASLKTLTSAQADFRLNDRDGNGTHDFWRGDVAGLYGIRPPGSADPIKLVEVSVAEADERPLAPWTPPSPKAGYWFRSLRHKGETEPDPDRFAFACFPAAYPRPWRWTYIVDETNTIYKKDLGGRAIEVYPADPIAEGWTRLD